MTQEITDAQVTEFTSKGVAVLDCWAPWCGPCKMIAPIIDELSNEMTNVNFAKINIDENSETPTKHGIVSIPTILIFKDGKVVDKVIGFKSKQEIKEKIQAQL